MRRSTATKIKEFLLSWWRKRHLHLRCDYSSRLPSHCEGKKITMPPHRGSLHHPTKFFPSLGHNAHCGTGKLRWRSQAGDTLHGHHWYPINRRTLCPIPRCSKLQHGHNGNHLLPTEGKMSRIDKPHWNLRCGCNHASPIHDVCNCREVIHCLSRPRHPSK